MKVEKESSITDPWRFFSINKLWESRSIKKHDRFFPRSLIHDTFRHRWAQVQFSNTQLMENPTPIYVHNHTPCPICRVSLPDWLALRFSFYLGPVVSSHTRAEKSIDVEGFSQTNINENSRSTLPIPDFPTKKETWWDILMPDTFIFDTFKGILNSKTRISY